MFGEVFIRLHICFSKIGQWMVQLGSATHRLSNQRVVSSLLIPCWYVPYTCSSIIECVYGFQLSFGFASRLPSPVLSVSKPFSNRYTHTIKNHSKLHQNHVASTFLRRVFFSLQVARHCWGNTSFPFACHWHTHIYIRAFQLFLQKIPVFLSCHHMLTVGTVIESPKISQFFFLHMQFGYIHPLFVQQSLLF